MTRMRIFKRTKIPNVMITSCNRDYDGSISIDYKLLEQYGIAINEQVHVLGVNNVSRAVTYAIEGQDGEICCNGGLANIFKPGDVVNIVTYEVVA